MKRSLKISVVGIALALGCQTSPNKIEGTWIRVDDVVNRINVEFRKDGSYILHDNKISDYPGNYKIAEGQITFNDHYCGTSLTGIYKIKELNNKKIDLELVTDNYCGRKDYFPGIWKRLK